MSDLKLPQDDNKKPGGVSTSRLVIWLVVGAVGAYLVISGVIGIINGGSGVPVIRPEVKR